MEYTIASGALRAVVSDRGAELLRLIQTKSGRELLWSGNPAYWAEHAPVLFPMIGRCREDRYLVNGESYTMGLHGFSRERIFSCVKKEVRAIELTLIDTPQTRARYPFSFRFTVRYALEGAALHVTYRTENRGKETMYFAVGGHPGFSLPMGDHVPFDRHFAVFSGQPEEVVIAPKCMRTGEIRPFPLENGTLRLRHSLFDQSARILQNAGDTVRLAAEGGAYALEIRTERMPYLGLWHTLRTDAPFVCIEPWSSLPGAYGAVEEISQRQDLIALTPGKTDERGWRVAVI